jgi:hypothetical protein
MLVFVLVMLDIIKMLSLEIVISATGHAKLVMEQIIITVSLVVLVQTLLVVLVIVLLVHMMQMLIVSPARTAVQHVMD